MVSKLCVFISRTEITRIEQDTQALVTQDTNCSSHSSPDHTSHWSHFILEPHPPSFQLG